MNLTDFGNFNAALNSDTMLCLPWDTSGMSCLTSYEVQIAPFTLALCYIALTNFGKYAPFPPSRDLVRSDATVMLAYLSGPIIGFILLVSHPSVPVVSRNYLLIWTIGSIQLITVCVFLTIIIKDTARFGADYLKFKQHPVAVIFIISTHTLYFVYTWYDGRIFHFYGGIFLIVVYLWRVLYARWYDCPQKIRDLENKDQLFDIEKLMDLFKDSVDEKVKVQKEKTNLQRLKRIADNIEEIRTKSTISQTECERIVNIYVREVSAPLDAVPNEISSTLNRYKEESIATITKIRAGNQNDKTHKIKQLESATQTFVKKFNKDLQASITKNNHDLELFPFGPILEDVRSKTQDVKDSIKVLRDAIPPNNSPADQTILMVYQSTALIFNIVWGLLMATAFYPHNTLKSSLMYVAMYYCLRLVPLARWTLRSMINWGWEGIVILLYIQFALTSESLIGQIVLGAKHIIWKTKNNVLRGLNTLEEQDELND